ncbi:cellulose biosynthesis cyclic di-GMP-binding regulatory protein BcsB [Acidovorax sp. Leaf78]|uniref:cellulose biosynthesis cyclic di-GMP-binding regulatory protein BcsB n=1 Tax=unclassified Acidovorax TaxID=2684926 RepID=UPI0006FCCD0D|nr:cellulose biosynthesis cyclic di-GMP-binding regulatory protein BcsB [Acidovorax sp. Leaf78]KQO16918.1 cellulose synthase BcsB subunit [Acidovorax sp. Leaf78]
MTSTRQPTDRLPRQRMLPAMLALALAGTAAPVSQLAAAPAPAPAAETTAGSLPSEGGVRVQRNSFKDLGALFPLQLRGVDGTSGVAFSVRNDEVVTGAKLKLNYSYSPALLTNLSHIKVMVNEQVAATIPVTTQQAGENLQREITIPPRLITEFNRLNLQLIGHYTMECEDPLHSSLWANIGNDSVLELTVAPVAQTNDLALLPQPFFDRRDVRPLELPIVFNAAPNTAALQAAGTMSSWFGALAGFRGAKFPSLVGELPARGNAVVMVAGRAQVPAGLSLPDIQGPTVAVVSHPADRNGKLLLVMGRDDAELATAAKALAVGSSALSGSVARITDVTELKPRKPYDAPHWLANDRPVKFGELVEAPTLNVTGYSPDLIRVNFFLPPDLFAWRQKGIPVDLRYRYTPRPNADKSTLNINVNQQFLRSLPLRSATHEEPGALDRLLTKVMPLSETGPEREKFHIPLFKLPSQSQLQLHYYYDVVKQGACKDVPLDNVRGSVEADSTIDISGFKHFIAMPDLAAFGNAGFPFTRMADLSDTAVVMPDKPGLAEYGTYLGLMGIMGRVTGHPAMGVTVAQAQQVDKLSDKDLLVISSGGGNQPLLKQWASSIPAALQGETKSFQLADVAHRLMRWWGFEDEAGVQTRRNQVAFSSSSTDAFIAGFESPLKSGRSVVLVASNQPAGLSQVVDALLDADALTQVQGSTTVIRGKQVDSLLAEKNYYVGQLGPVLYAQWFLSRNPLLLILLGVSAAVLVAIVMYLSLRARARARLKQKA